MTANPPAADLPALYLADEVAWLDETVRLLTAGRVDRLDVGNLTEYLQSMAERDRREALSRVRVLLVHLLKWQFQPTHRGKSWSNTIAEQRDELADILTSRTLRNHVAAELPATYARAVRGAARETELPPATFPAECPYALDQVLDPDFLPG